VSTSLSNAKKTFSIHQLAQDSYGINEPESVAGPWQNKNCNHNDEGSQDCVEGATFFIVQQGIMRNRTVIANAYDCVSIPHRRTLTGQV
jgi:hypothetical protein